MFLMSLLLLLYLHFKKKDNKSSKKQHLAYKKDIKYFDNYKREKKSFVNIK